MNTIYLVASLVALASQGMFYFMAAVLSVPGTETETATKFGDTVLNISIFALPGICIIAGIILVVAYLQHWHYVYSWVLLPIPFFIAFVVIRIMTF